MSSILSDKLSLAFLLLLLLSACKKEGLVDSSGEWLLPTEQVLSGGPGKDGIPSIDDPKFIKTSDVTFLDDHDLVLGIKVGNEIRAYPHPILDWHEIVNDDIDEVSIAVTYCPLTGTGIGWDRNVGGKNTTFGVSGLLYQSNLIPYDRRTDSHWSQIRLDCVNGELIETKINTISLIEMNWKTWKTLFPDSRVVSTDTGHDRDYDRYPYRDYKTGDYTLFPVYRLDATLHKKERVLGVISGERARAYPFHAFREEKINLLFDEHEGEEVMVIGSESEGFMVAYKNELTDGTSPEWQAVQDGGPIVAVDDNGNRLNVFGEVEEGPKQGEKLKHVESFMGYWFAWVAFYNMSLYE